MVREVHFLGPGAPFRGQVPGPFSRATTLAERFFSGEELFTFPRRKPPNQTVVVQNGLSAQKLNLSEEDPLL
jgi:hypothetical protein